MITKHPPLDHEPADRGFIERGLRELVANAVVIGTCPVFELNEASTLWRDWRPLRCDETDPQRRSRGV
jgi:hypothetical protein